MENPLNNPQPNPLNNPHALKDSILKQIAEGSVSVTPKWRFTAVSVVSGVGLLVGFLAVLFVLTLIHFSLKEAGAYALPEFGGEGIREFFLSFPWIPLVLVVVAALALEFWLLRYAFAYRRPMLYSVFGIAVCLTLGTVLVAAAKVHESVYEVAEADNVPLVRPLYHSFAEPASQKLHRGMVAELEDQGFLMRERSGDIMQVMVTRQTHLAPPVAVRVGEMVIVFGQNADGSIQAIGIKHVPGNAVFFQETR